MIARSAWVKLGRLCETRERVRACRRRLDGAQRGSPESSPTHSPLPGARISWNRTRKNLSVRLLVLIVGPALLIGSCWLLAAPSPLKAGAAARPMFPAGGTVGAAGYSLESACAAVADELRARLSESCRVVACPPYVLAGDLSEEELERQHGETIVPTAHALSVGYFDVVPAEPIVIVMLSGEKAYRESAQRLDGMSHADYHGYYRREDRRIVLNLATGNGTLAHELTHALAHFDFPELPEWFDEGLASLHEECEFSEDGQKLIGRSNWRRHYLLQALRNGSLRPLDDLFVSREVRPGSEAIDYAHARFFCLYLQERDWLAPFYRKFRTNAAQDPTGRETLCRLTGAETLEVLDEDFRRWVLESEAPR